MTNPNNPLESTGPTPSSRLPPKLPGMVYLVGAGPGDPGLLTLQGAEVLRRADVVLYDYLVNPVIARHAGQGVELICLGRHGRTRIWTQDEINQQLLKLAQDGKTVVRLKSGDPAIFARAAEEAAFLVQHGVPFETVPGITAAMAVSSYAGIPLTHREHASAVAFVTGRERTGQAEKLDYAALAKFPGTLVIYMGVTTAESWSGQLMHHGMDAGTPVALVRRCSHTDQQTIRCRLDEVVQNLTPYSKFPPPVLVVIGEVTRDPQVATWFEQRPLFGQRVLLTRPAHQTMSLCQQLEEAGAQVILQPAIKIESVPATDQLNDQLNRIGEFDWLTFSSSNGVAFFFEHLLRSKRDVRSLGDSQIAAVGAATARALRDHGVNADLVPEKFNAECLAKQLVPKLNNASCLVIRGTRSREMLDQALSDARANWESLIVYSSQDVEKPGEDVSIAMQSGSIDWTFVTSPSIAKSVACQFGKALAHTKIVSISPLTSTAVKQAGLAVELEAGEATTSSMVNAVLELVANHRPD